MLKFPLRILYKVKFSLNSLQSREKSIFKRELLDGQGLNGTERSDLVQSFTRMFNDGSPLQVRTSSKIVKADMSGSELDADDRPSHCDNMSVQNL